MFALIFTASAQKDLEALERTPRHEGLVRQIKKSLAYLQHNPKHPSRHTHPYSSISHPFNPKEKVFEAYAQNRTPSAYRIFWCYGPEKHQLTILAVTPHP
ncbi:MAG: hypothetical protein HY598_02635 [Candidatus Omnitrophica bacterium]|nr:hypothetical protein [Candidatus Omnitrophota bacterium]